MMKKVTGLILLLVLAACDINQPKAPQLNGQWQCQNGITITFKGPKDYTVADSAGESDGVYKLTPGENGQNRIDWNPGIKDAAAPLPSRFRYFESGRLARLFFYTQVTDESVPCERRL
jgi:hypothetical protein